MNQKNIKKCKKVKKLSLSLDSISVIRYKDSIVIEGLEYFTQGLRLNRQDSNIFQAMYPCLLSLAPADIIAFLNGLYDKDADAAFLEEQLRGRRAGRVYLYYAKRSDPAILESVPGYLAAGQYAAAAIQSMDCLRGFYQAGLAAAQTEE